MNPYDIIPDRDPSVPEGSHPTIFEYRDVHVHERDGLHADGWALHEFVEFLQHESMFVGTFYDTTEYFRATSGGALHFYTAKRVHTGYGGRVVQTTTQTFFHGAEPQSEEEGRQA